MMSVANSSLPRHRRGLVIRAVGNTGQVVVKNPESGEFFQIGEQAHFLLMQLDGSRSPCEVCSAFEKKFADALSELDLNGFLQMAARQGLLETANEVERLANPQIDSKPPTLNQNILHWRKPFFDPDRLFNWLEPRIGFFWTAWFLVISASSIALAALIVWTNAGELHMRLVHVLQAENAIWICLTIFTVVMLHEFAHGLTCKHFGGEVHEIGFLLMFFLPCLYCNVSEAWLFSDRSRRLWVTFAGGYFQLFLWSLAVFTWRVTLPGTFPNYLALLVVTYSGVETLFNFNPLIKLDGYYLLSDWLNLPNLHERGVGHFKSYLRSWLWGAAPPKSVPRGGTLLTYGLCSWVYSVLFLCFVISGMFWCLAARWGVTGMCVVAVIGLVGSRRVFEGTTAGEAWRLLTSRYRRLVASLVFLTLVGATMVFVQVNDWVAGRFTIRPAARVELRASMPGFVKAVNYDEGDRIPSGSVVAQLDVPDLASRVAQKQAEIREAQANLRLLENGVRTEEICEARERVERAQHLLELSQHDLKKLQEVLSEELTSADTQVTACKAELQLAQDKEVRAKLLVEQKAISDEEFQELVGNYRVASARLAKVEAERRAKQAEGTLKAETELANRECQFAEAKSALRLLEAGSRPEQIQAERARLARLDEERQYLEELRDRVIVRSAICGLMVTPRMKEKIGQFVHEGDLIGVVEEPANSDVEIAIAEQDVGRIKVGDEAILKARALPFETFTIAVNRIAPAADQGDVQNSVTVYCRLSELPEKLRPGMTGYARIQTGSRPIGEILLKRLLRFVRTEFWPFW
jgi:putative peptide zinc metalloprotease protein